MARSYFLMEVESVTQLASRRCPYSVPLRESVDERERERERERENSELYYSRIKILGSCLFLQSVPANLQRERERESVCEGERERERVCM